MKFRSSSAFPFLGTDSANCMTRPLTKSRLPAPNASIIKNFPTVGSAWLDDNVLSSSVIRIGWLALSFARVFFRIAASAGVGTYFGAVGLTAFLDIFALPSMVVRACLGTHVAIAPAKRRRREC